ncbi:hypothetical protein UFOVP1383_57 [uncultured Caudovirales phage]|uniref:Uncharacterized protein n=1 Tax=uncultured Caudovirales phage TaxID=2100421 RepID=A0A6J5SN40_9CAUD|nr:hypothetical protein UFOVP848_43 [uncultured Caudovirales phage]CAB4173163.1 hypothetical protein UFOVP945_22 [uncultured Caudovirales phage]CAB4179623.1 hypothetical protein UFOVP1023_20 [uncultured Caudovirales phage]CAB4204338.1 hypothetical protein UFOVP1383_57 [uncultured Caudovirales phage]CAB4216054.1 hypothetical protein UFOVP1477_50 [uncultured Caudovirales phage]
MSAFALKTKSSAEFVAVSDVITIGMLHDFAKLCADAKVPAGAVVAVALVPGNVVAGIQAPAEVRMRADWPLERGEVAP